MKFVLSSLLILSSITSALASTSPCDGESGTYFANSNGEIGGFVAHTAFVDKTVYLGKHVQICGNAEARDFAQITGNAIIKDDARIYDSAKVFGNAIVFENAEVYETASVWGNAQVFGQARVYGFAGLKDNVKVFGVARMYEATYGGDAVYF
jgi:UDP-3-O-[3-hydroxymyristoyl] glucosamine N-acyltransferase